MIDYDSKSAQNYGVRFGNMYENGIFKRMKEDSTNFVCQCIWAAYGGTNGYSLSKPEDVRALKNRVRNMYRQTHFWYGLDYNSLETYGSPAFIQSEELWDYVVNNTNSGPRAHGYNNGKLWSELAVDVEQGDVIQFYQEEVGKYVQCVIVVSDEKQNIVESMEGVYVSQHFTDYSYRPLQRAFEEYCNYETGKLRVLKFLPAYF